MAFCTQCGFQVTDDASFCSNCGAKIVKPIAPKVPVLTNEFVSPVNETEVEADRPMESEASTGNYSGGNSDNGGYAYDNSYKDGTGSSVPPTSEKRQIFSKDTMELLVQITAVILAVINACMFIKHGVGSVSGAVRNLLNLRIGFVFVNIFKFVFAVGCGASALVLADSVINWSKEKASKYLLALTCTSVVSTVAHFIFTLISFIAIKSKYSGSVWPVMLKYLLFAVLSIAIWVVVMYVAKINVIEDINTRNIIDEVKASIALVLDELKQELDRFNSYRAKKASEAKENRLTGQPNSQVRPGPAYKQAQAAGPLYNTQANGAPYTQTAGPAYANVNMQQQYGRPMRPFRPLKTDRSLLVYILLSFVTCGIYGIIFWYSFCEDMNVVCEGDGKNTPNYIVIILLSLITCGIYGIVAFYQMAERIYDNGRRYQVPITHNGSSFLLWSILGSFLCGIGTLVAYANLIGDFNTLCYAYNSYNYNNQQ